MKRLYFDSSAVFPILLEEVHSASAIQAIESAEICFAWEWMQVEVDAALMRRKADAMTLRSWHKFLGRFNLLRLPEDAMREVCQFNRSTGLRAADAGHLFLFEQAAMEIRDLELVSFDREMLDAAEMLGLRVFSGVF